MTQKEKLMELLEEEKAVSRYLTNDEKRERLACHLLENGVIVPPVKVGDTVYLPSYSRDVQLLDILEETITKVNMSGFCSSEDAESMPNNFQWEWNDIGQYIFLTREEAEKALEERRGGHA